MSFPTKGQLKIIWFAVDVCTASAQGEASDNTKSTEQFLIWNPDLEMKLNNFVFDASHGRMTNFKPYLI
jgi:hypothetical protein